ncbi:RDD family protein [Arthrobacter alpinus]|uniref:RDD family protein n=1 Tax=Arthrobacter alpinus TaxID=656366 RepID=UPI0016463D60|nr:RDD family protein [Arthrobacter alpinus]
MARKVAEPCRNCGAALAPGSAFCTLCGASVPNRAAVAAPGSVPLVAPGTQQPSTVPPVTSVPGAIQVGLTQPAPLMPPQQVGTDPRLSDGTDLVPGGAGRRLLAWVIDSVLPGILIGVAVAVGIALMSEKVEGGYRTIDFSWLLILTGIAFLLSLGYRVWLWIWEAKAGKTPGNVMLGLRTTNIEGGPPGLLAIFLRTVIIALGSVVPYVGSVLLVVSNAWDTNGKRQGWHDKVANTLVWNVKAGRDPLETGGLAGRVSFAPAPMPAISHVNSPLAQAPQAQMSPANPPLAQMPQAPQQFAPPAVDTFAPPARQPAAPGPLAAPGPVPGAAVPQPMPADQDDLGETRVRPAATSGLRLTFDDGRTETVATVALLGRNPAGYDGEMIERLVSVQDSSRSVSKTHLHLQVAPEGLWVTDRNSTNGSAITHPPGLKSPLPGGVPQLADIGDTVHFGDRSFLVGRA